MLLTKIIIKQEKSEKRQRQTADIERLELQKEQSDEIRRSRTRGRRSLLASKEEEETLSKKQGGL